MMPETTGWKPSQLPQWPKKDDTFRLLVILGNVAHFAGDMPLVLWPELVNIGDWDHVVYVPGLRDYGGGGTLQLGDEYLARLEQWDERLTVFGPGCKTKSIYFTGPKVFIAG